MIHKILLGFGDAMLVFMVVACAGNAADSVSLEEKLAQRGFTIRQPIKRVNNPRVLSWSSIDREHLIIKLGASRYYLLTLRTTCNPILSAPSISFSNTSGYLTDNGQVLVQDSREHVAHCSISTIHELEKVKTIANR